MGQSAAETVKEIERTRERLAEELDELEDRLPAAAVAAKRAAQIATGTGVVGTIGLFVIKRARRKRKQEAKIVAAQPMQIKLEMPERWGELLADPRAKQWIVGAGGVWLLLRLAELRSLRKLRRAQLA